jgi:alpha-L-fucosidase
MGRFSRSSHCWKAAVVLAIALTGGLSAHAEDGATAKQQHALIGVEQSGPSATISHDGAGQWFPQAGLGMFIHWGISSVEAKHELSWALLAKISWNPHPLTPEAYFQLADRFNPRQYDPEKWLRAAKDAGFGYAVLTTRHHDGYALWPSQYGDFSTRTKMGGRDLLRPYVEACRKVGMKVGFYYSPPDWHYHRHYMSFGYQTKGTPDSPHLGLKHEPVQLPAEPTDFDNQFVAYINGQLTELLTRYGKIDLLWFDGSWGPKVLSQEQIRALQPGIVINDRQHGHGDFQTQFEGELPKKRPSGRWECCFSMVGAWGYTDSEFCSPAALLLARLAKCRAWGGNVLANFGPRPDGQLPESVYRCMGAMKDWMATRRQSVIDVEAGPYPQQSNVPVTVRNKTWYLFLLPETADGPAFTAPVVLKNVGKPQRVVMLGADKRLDYHAENSAITITVPKELRTSLVDVIAVDW